MALLNDRNGHLGQVPGEMNNTDDPSQFNRRDSLNSSASGFAMAMAGGAILEINPVVLGQTEEALKSDSTPPKVSVIVPVRNIESGKQRMNEVMHGAMNAQKHKFARYNLTEIKVADNKRKAGDPILFDTKGTLNVNGKSVPVSMQVSIAKWDEDKLKASGKTKLRMSQFGISPPAPKITLGLITTDDEVSVEFDWFVALKK